MVSITDSTQARSAAALGSALEAQVHSAAHSAGEV